MFRAFRIDGLAMMPKQKQTDKTLNISIYFNLQSVDGVHTLLRMK